MVCLLERYVTLPGLLLGAGLVGALAFAATASPAGAQGAPALPDAAKISPPVEPGKADAKPSPPLVNTLIGAPPAVAPRIEVRKAARPEARAKHRRVARRSDSARLIERPALGGILLEEPIPLPVRPPRPIMPTPAYFVDGIALPFTQPPPPVVCHPRPRDPGEARLFYREVPVVCDYDID